MPAHSVERRHGAALPMNVVASSMTEWSKTAVPGRAAALRRAPRGIPRRNSSQYVVLSDHGFCMPPLRLLRRER